MNHKMRERPLNHLQIVRIDLERLKLLLPRAALPDDALILGSYIDQRDQRTLCFLVESKTFPSIADGVPIPQHDAEI